MLSFCATTPKGRVVPATMVGTEELALFLFDATASDFARTTSLKGRDALRNFNFKSHVPVASSIVGSSSRSRMSSGSTIGTASPPPLLLLPPPSSPSYRQ
jgi:hypothetical protein